MMIASLLTKEDCAIGILVSGSTKDTIYSLEIAKRAGAKIICMINNGKSPITKLADVVHLLSSQESPLEGISIISQIAQLSVIGILCAAIHRMEHIARKGSRNHSKNGIGKIILTEKTKISEKRVFKY